MLILWGFTNVWGRGRGGEGHKKYIWGIAYKAGLDNLQGGLAKSRESAFEGG